MTINRRRRRLLLASAGTIAGASVAGNWPLSALAARPQPADESRFSFDALVARARELAKQRYVPAVPRYAELLDALGYEAFTKIHTRRDHALWANDKNLAFTVEFFPLDQNARDPVTIHVVDHAGRSHRLIYKPDLFSFDDPAVAAKLPDDLGFSGFRLRSRRDDNEWLAFKGASYFRSPGALNQYGLSARGVAVDTGFGHDETFPHFSAYWLFKPAPGEDSLTICALLEGQCITGAYRMRCRRTDNVVMDIETRLFQRDSIRRLGIAPLTSMFWFSETNCRRGTDWRPEIHDSDGLAIATGDGQRLWRALANPPQAQFSTFPGQNPRGFGLLQRDRQFDHYQDSRVFFERRPSLWVEPRGDWGQGHVGLLELPTAEEVYDNINAFWVPATDSTQPGHTWHFDYRLHWTDKAPYPPSLARVMATRTGRAGQPGTYQDQSPLARKFVIDFEGGPLATLAPDSKIEVMTTASHGEIFNPYPKKIGDTARWHVFIDWRGEAPAEGEPVTLRCWLVHKGKTLTETWVYTYFPRPLPQL